jgi:hypothetical protein
MSGPMSSVFVSKMSGKLAGFRAVNTSPLSNAFCLKMEKASGTVCANCYSLKQMRTYRLNMIPPLTRNGELLSSRPLNSQEIPKFRPGETVRFNAHGELINIQHFENLLAIARHNPESTFALWTKRHDVATSRPDKIPDNLRLIYSHPTVNQTYLYVPRGFDQVFAVYTPNFAKKHNVEINCKRRCADCMQCYAPRGEGIRVVRELMK